jgi:hypothetical protein
MSVVTEDFLSHIKSWAKLKDKFSGGARDDVERLVAAHQITLEENAQLRGALKELRRLLRVADSSQYIPPGVFTAMAGIATEALEGK